jgi:hypothetical protein
MATRDRRHGGLARYAPAVGWLPRYERRWLRGDLMAGIAVTTLVVPKNVGYAVVAGVPPQNGRCDAAAGRSSTPCSVPRGRSRLARVHRLPRSPAARCLRPAFAGRGPRRWPRGSRWSPGSCFSCVPRSGRGGSRCSSRKRSTAVPAGKRSVGARGPGAARIGRVRSRCTGGCRTLRLARAKAPVLEVLGSDGILELIGSGHIHGNVDRAIEAQIADGETSGPPPGRDAAGAAS